MVLGTRFLANPASNWHIPHPWQICPLDYDASAWLPCAKLRIGEAFPVATGLLEGIEGIKFSHHLGL